ncbi:MAG: hypothetical protein JXA37_07020 [Chloroflexia bacterium]|nr:hypothetical protein [Chloroflexia bacterium]
MTLRFGGATLLAVLLLGLFSIIFVTFWVLWYRRGRIKQVSLRPLEPIEALRTALRRAAEMGETVHLSPGGGSLHQADSAAETLAGLAALRGVAEEALSLGVPVQASSNDALVNVMAEKALSLAMYEAGQPAGLRTESRFVAQQNPLAYAAGVMDTLGQPDVQANVLIGSFGEEILLMGEIGAEQTSFQVIGATRLLSMPFLPLLTQEFLLGEEVYAAPAYLKQSPVRMVGILVQDGIRMVLLLLIVLGVILATVGALERTLGFLLQMPLP